LSEKLGWTRSRRAVRKRRKTLFIEERERGAAQFLGIRKKRSEKGRGG